MPIYKTYLEYSVHLNVYPLEHEKEKYHTAQRSFSYCFLVSFR